ncbi:MAG: NAD(P)/FAD-dependent oxidoreductase [Actinomycetota bacterium]
MHDVVVIGGGSAGESAATAANEAGASVAVVERELLGGECPFWACMPSKTLLDAAHRRALGSDYPWKRASDRRDWMISREGTDRQDDSGHARNFADLGIELVRGPARVVGPGRIEVVVPDGPPRTLEGRSLIVATGSRNVVPPLEGLSDSGYWTSREATTTRELPSSLVVLGGGPIGVELAQVFARFGSKVTLVEASDRILSRDHPLTSKAVGAQLAEDGVQLRLGVRAQKVESGGAGRKVSLSDGVVVEGAELLVAVGRRGDDLGALGLEETGARLTDGGSADPDERMAIGNAVFVAGDCAGGPQFTHLAYYEGRIAGRNAAGRPCTADLSSVPRATFTDPDAGAVGKTVEEAQQEGIDVFEVTVDFTTTARGQATEGSRGHVSVVVDRERKVPVGVFAAAPGASEFTGEAVIALKLEIPIPVLADAIHAFPTGSRALGTAFELANERLG